MEVPLPFLSHLSRDKDWLPVQLRLQNVTNNDKYLTYIRDKVGSQATAASSGSELKKCTSICNIQSGPSSALH